MFTHPFCLCGNTVIYYPVSEQLCKKELSTAGVFRSYLSNDSSSLSVDIFLNEAYGLICRKAFLYKVLMGKIYVIVCTPYFIAAVYFFEVRTAVESAGLEVVIAVISDIGKFRKGRAHIKRA